MDFGSVASLAVASLDLQVVQLLRDAIRTADLAGGVIGASGLRILERDRVIDEAILRREHFHPTPKFEPRPTYHPTPRFEARPVYHERVDCVSPSDTSGKTELAAVDRTPLPPPWKTPVWKMPLQPAPMVKVHIHRTDVHNKGSLLDLFC